MGNVLDVNGLVKRYGDKQALNGVTFSVKAGSCFGLLGPNGAGKSTTMKIITGILAQDAGTAHVLDLDSRSQADAIRRQVGYVPQEITLYDTISARRNLVFFGEMYGVKGDELKKRIEEVLEWVGLSDRANDAIRTYSGGMKRRINIAAALLHRPKLVILDEPTVGIDPQSRNHIFEMIRGLQTEGVSMVYSTHYMEEVEALCDELAIVDHGSVIAQGGLNELLDRYAAKAVYLEAEALVQPPQVSTAKPPVAQGRGWLYEADDSVAALRELSGTLPESGIKVKSLEIVRPSLESVFLSLTGTTLRDS